MMVLNSIMILAASVYSAHSLGDKCPENIQHFKDFDNGVYLIKEDEAILTECRIPDKSDSLMYLIGISKEISSRVVGVRHFKFDNSNYSDKDISSIFNTKLGKCIHRTDGLYECHSKDYRYSSISKSQNSFPFISQDRPEFNITYQFDTKKAFQPILYPLGKESGYYYINKEWQNPILPEFITKARLSNIGVGKVENLSLKNNLSFEFSRLDEYVKFQSSLQYIINDSVAKFIATHNSEYIGGKDTLDSLFVKQVINNIAKDSSALYHALTEVDTVMKFASEIVLDSLCRENKATKGKSIKLQNRTVFCDGDYENGLIGYYSNSNLAAFIDSQIYVPVYALFRDGEKTGSLHRMNIFIKNDGSIFVSSNQGILRWSYNDENNNLWVGDGTIWNQLAAIINGSEKLKNKNAPILNIVQYWYSFVDQNNDYRYACLNSINTSTDGIFGPGNSYSIHDRSLLKNVIYAYRDEVEKRYSKQTNLNAKKSKHGK